jgi:hypothetical protein
MTATMTATTMTTTMVMTTTTMMMLFLGALILQFFLLTLLNFFNRHYNRGRWLVFLGGACLRRCFLLCFFSHGRLIDLVQVWDYVFFLAEEKNEIKKNSIAAPSQISTNSTKSKISYIY